MRYVKKTLDAHKPEALGVITDFVDRDLTEFIKTVISGYCSIPYSETKVSRMRKDSVLIGTVWICLLVK